MNIPKLIYEKTIIMEMYEKEYFDLYHSAKYIYLRKSKWDSLRKQCLEGLAVLYKNLNNSNEIKKLEIFKSKMNDS